MSRPEYTRALEHFAMRRLGDAERSARDAMKADPSHLPTQALLGRILAQTGRAGDAIPLLQKADVGGKADAGALDDLGTALRAANRIDEAVSTLRRATQADPSFELAWYHLANALRVKKAYAESIVAYERAVQLEPKHAEAWCNLGNSQRDTQNFGNAEAAWRRALQARPDLPEAHTGLGRLLRDQGRFNEAIPHLEFAARARPKDADTKFALAASYRGGNRLQESIGAWRAVLEVRPDDVAARYNLGNALRTLRKDAEALQTYADVLSRSPNHTEAIVQMGLIYRDQGRSRDAESRFLAAITTNPNSFEAWRALGLLQEMEGVPDKAISSLDRALALKPSDAIALESALRARLAAASWGGIFELRDQLERTVRDGAVISPLSTLLFGFPTAVQQRNSTRHALTRLIPGVVAPQPRRRDAGARLRIGYLSGDLREHAMGFLLEHLFESHDRSRVEVFGYSFTPRTSDDLYSAFPGKFEHFHDISGISNEDACRQMRSDGIDVLVDLNAWTGLERSAILAHRPARVQVAMVAFAGPVGAAGLHDWNIADPIVAPADALRNYDEALCILPTCYMVQSPRGEQRDPDPRRAYGLPDDALVFASFNNTNKLWPEQVDIWARLLNAVPGSVIWLRSWHGSVNRNLTDEFEKRGVAAGRVVFAPPMPYHENYRRMPAADVFLDSWPYCAHTVAGDALWTGVPVVTLATDTWAGRVCASHLVTQGFPELVTSTVAEYERLALDLATDSGRRRDLRARIIARRTTGPLFDVRAYARHVEHAFEEMVRRTDAGARPQTFFLGDSIPPGGFPRQGSGGR